MCHPDKLTKKAKAIYAFEKIMGYFFVIALTTVIAALCKKYVFDTVSWYFMAGVIVAKYEGYREKL